MSAEANEALLRSYVSAVWNAGNPEAAVQYLATDFRRHTSATAPPLDVMGQVQRLRGFREAFPDVTITIEDVIAAPDRVAFRSTLRGTHLGTFLGIAPTGREVQVGLVDIIRIENGRFVEQWGGPDLFDLMRQLGAA